MPRQCIVPTFTRITQSRGKPVKQSNGINERGGGIKHACAIKPLYFRVLLSGRVKS